MKWPLIDAHVHCGRQVKTDPVTGKAQPQDLIDYLAWAEGSGIVGAVMFSPVPEVYNRLDPHFVDNAEWQARRRDSNSYLLSLDPVGFEVFPYFFIWNDFAVDHLSPRHQGIKWHRHSDEPRYQYDDPRCAAAIAEIRRRDLTVCLEEEWDYTWRFLTELAPGVRVVIPHCGRLNGGYERFCAEGLWGQPNVWTDISNASTEWAMDYLARRLGAHHVRLGLPLRPEFGRTGGAPGGAGGHGGGAGGDRVPECAEVAGGGGAGVGHPPGGRASARHARQTSGRLNSLRLGRALRREARQPRPPPVAQVP